MAGPSDVVVVGGVGIDTNVYLYGRDIDFSVEMNFSRNVDVVGGSGGYAARSYAALGLQTAFVGFVGDDMGGREVRRVLGADGVDLAGLAVCPHGTKRSVNFMYPDGRRRNFYDGRGSMETSIDPATVRETFRGARLAHFGIVDWARRLLTVARDEGVVIGCDLQDVVDPDDAYRRDFVDGADIPFFSATNPDDPRPLVDAFLARRPDAIVVCGMGSRGSLVAGRDLFVHRPAIVEGPPGVDTNGAGDCLAVGFLVGHVLEGRPPAEALLWGTVLARHCCTLQGTNDGLLTKAELHCNLGPPRR